MGRLERHQVGIYLGAIATGALLGASLPVVAGGLEPGINPVLGALLYVTFLQVPVGRLVEAGRDLRFLGAVLVLNFAVVPLIVAAGFAVLPPDQAIRVGVLLVLLCPCVDYVIVFSGLAGADSRRLLAATPLLLLVQLSLLPLFLLAFLGSDLAEIVEIGPFITAFVVLIAVPLALAGLTQAAAGRWEVGARAVGAIGATMVPLLALTLLIVVASQIPALDGHAGAALSVIPFYAGFLVVTAFAGAGVARLFGLGPAAARAAVFSGATRNSLVVLPLALALPDRLGLAVVVVVTQTLVEVIGMVAYVHLVPRLVPFAATIPPATEPVVLRE